MESFEALGVKPELVEALAAEGIEVPTTFQASAIPVLLRDNALLAQAGPGAGTLLAYGIPLLQGTDPEARGPRALVLTPTPERAAELGRALSRLAVITGHRVSALGSTWALPELSSILFATPVLMLDALRESEIDLEEIEALVVDGFNAMEEKEREALESLFEAVSGKGLRVLLSLPFTPEAEAFGKAHFHRPVHLPPRAADGTVAEPVPERGRIRYRVTGEDKELVTLRTVGEILEAGAGHVLLFTPTDDQAADLGDFLALHGFIAGPPGDGSAPVWLSARELEARKVLDEWGEPGVVVTLSVDVPSSPDALDQRHGGNEDGIILLRARELPHLRDIAKRAGYRLIPAHEPPPARISGELERLSDLLTRTLKEEDLGPHYLALEPLLRDYQPGEVAAAALALLRKARSGSTREESESRGRPQETGRGPAPKTWVRLFVGVGEKEEIGPGDLLGAIAGEAGVEGSQVGKIEIRETFSLVEVASQVADQVIRGLNGTTIRGRSVRADYDRGGPKGRGGRKPGRGGRHRA